MRVQNAQPTNLPTRKAIEPTDDTPPDDAFGALYASLVGTPTRTPDPVNDGPSAEGTTDAATPTAPIASSDAPVTTALVAVDEGTGADPILIAPDPVTEPTVDAVTDPSIDDADPTVEETEPVTDPELVSTTGPESTFEVTTQVAEDAAPTELAAMRSNAGVRAHELSPHAATAAASRFEAGAVTTARADTPSAPAPAPADPPAPSPPVTQVVQRVVAFSKHDGTHRVQLELHPAELGHVALEMRVERGVVHLHVLADNPETAVALRAQLGSLRADLEQSGLQAGNLDVGGAPSRSDERSARDSDADADSDAESIATAPIVPATTAQTSSTSELLDVRI